MLNRKFPLWGTWVPDDMPLRLTLLALPRVNRMKFLAPSTVERCWNLSIRPTKRSPRCSHQSVQRPGKCQRRPGHDASWKKTLAWGERFARTSGLTRLRVHAGLHLNSVSHSRPSWPGARTCQTRWVGVITKEKNASLTSPSARWPWRAQRWGSPTPSAGSAWSSRECRGLRAPSEPWRCSSGGPGCHCWGSWCAAAEDGAWPGTPGHLEDR